MTMHLLPPMYSTTGKVKGKKKWPSAEAKRKAEMLELQWKDLLKKQGIEAEEKRRKRALESGVLTSSPRIPPGRETAKIASLDTGWVPCTKTTDKVYTGSAVVGIATLHKSNGVPVFSQQEAEDVAKMRR